MIHYFVSSQIPMGFKIKDQDEFLEALETQATGDLYGPKYIRKPDIPPQVEKWRNWKHWYE